MTLGLQTVTIGTNSGTGATFSGVISGTGAVTKTGTGTQTFGGSTTNTYSGLTTVSGGTLLLSKLNGVTATQAIANGGLTIGSATNTAALVQYAASTANPDMMGTGAVTLNGQGQLDFNGATDTIGLCYLHRGHRGHRGQFAHHQ